MTPLLSKRSPLGSSVYSESAASSSENSSGAIGMKLGKSSYKLQQRVHKESIIKKITRSKITQT